MAAGVVLSVLLSGCGAAITPFGGPGGASSIKTEAVQQPARHSICVVSALGNMFAVSSFGLTMFSNDTTMVNIDSWQLDEFVRTRMHQIIGTRFDVSPIKSSGSPFASLDQPGALFRNKTAERNEIVRKLVLGERCEYVLLVVPASSTVSTTNQSVRGVGIVRNGDGLIVDNVHVFALAKIVLMENGSFKELTEQVLTSPNQQTGLFSTISGPHRKLDAKDWPVPAHTVDNLQMRATIVAMLDAALTVTLPEVVSVK